MQNRITKEELESLPIVEFVGNIHVIDNLAQAAEAVEAIRRANTLIGFDTETRPAFKKGVTHRVALVQLSVDNTCYLFRIKKMNGLGTDLYDLLCDPQFVKVGLATHDDFMNLRKWNPNLYPKGVIEIQELIKNFGIEDMSLAKIYAILFNKKISKRQRLTNWEADELTDRQCQYAALDAVACVEIYNELLKMGNRIINI